MLSKLTKDLVAIDSVSQHTNRAVSDYLEDWLTRANFTVERLTYQDENDEEKVNLIALKGDGAGGLGFFSHSDVVPGGEGWNPFDPVEQNGQLIGRGSCDMKGPLAATMVAAASVDVDRLQKPVYVVIAADEEVGHKGAIYLTEHSTTLQENWPDFGVIAEPTQLTPVYAHKGGTGIVVTAHGFSAHTSTDLGTSANFIIAPFLAEMAELRLLFQSDARFQNPEFSPPTNGFNITINDGGTKANVTAAKTVCTMSIRAMTNDNHEEAVGMIIAAAEKYGLDVTRRSMKPFYNQPDAEIIQSACRATDIPKAVTVPYGTEASGYQEHLQAVILGPGNIAQAHTVGEWIDVGQLQESVGVYGKMIEELCM